MPILPTKRIPIHARVRDSFGSRFARVRQAPRAAESPTRRDTPKKKTLIAEGRSLLKASTAS